MHASLSVYLLVATLWLLPCCGFCSPQDTLPPCSQTAAEPFPDLRLPPPATATGSGLPAGAMALSGFSEEIIIINMYSWFCAPCQAEGPDLKYLAGQIGPDGTDGKIRIIGIAAGDDPTLTARFARRHGLEYALYPDPDLALHKAAGSPAVPSFFVVRNTPTGPVLLFRHTGAILGQSGAFLSRVRECAGIPPLPTIP